MFEQLTHAEWVAEAKSRFGENPLGWKFVCPSCGHVASVEEWRAAGASEGAVAFSCIGRQASERGIAASAAFRHNGGPCNYTGGGLLRLNPVLVDFMDGTEPRPTFEFAAPPHEVGQTV